MAQPQGEEYEPRFAGSAPAGYVAPGTGRSPWASETAPPMGYAPPVGPQPPMAPPPMSMPPAVLEPEVDYWTGEPPAAPRSISVDLRGGVGLLVAAVGAVLAVVSSQLTWATLKLDTGAQLPSDSGSTIKYAGSSLIEGRAMLVAGVLALVFSGLVLLRRPLVIGVWVTGAVALATAAFAAISHPADLATLLHVNQQVDDVSVSAPNGSGVWLALAGSALILIGGLVAQFLRNFRSQQYPTLDPQTGPAEVPGV